MVGNGRFPTNHHCHCGLGLQIVIPGRGAGLAPVGSDEDDLTVVGDADEGHRPGLAAARAGGGEGEEGQAGKPGEGGVTAVAPAQNQPVQMVQRM